MRPSRPIPKPLDLNEALDDQEGILETLDTLSALMVKTENPNAAILHAQRGIQLADELSDTETKMYLLTTLGDARQQDGESDTAVQAFQQALEIARTDGDSQNEALILFKTGLRAVGQQRRGHRRRNLGTGAHAVQGPG